MLNWNCCSIKTCCLVTRVGKTWLRCHNLDHDHAMITAWRPCFLAWSSWFMAWSWFDYHVSHDSYHDHGMIIMFSMFFFKKKDCLSMFCQIVAQYTIVWLTWLALEVFTLLHWRVSKTEQIILQVIWEFSSVITREQVLFEQYFQYNIYITAFCYFW